MVDEQTSRTRRRRQLLTTAAPISVQEHQNQQPVLPQGESRDQPHRDPPREAQSERASDSENSRLSLDRPEEQHSGQSSDSAVGAAKSGEVVRRRRQRRTKSATQTLRHYLGRRELLAVVPLSMSSIDTLEKNGNFPSRFVLSPTVKVCWRRHEVEKWLAERARRRVHQAPRASDVIEGNGQGAETIDDLVVRPSAKPDAPRRHGTFQPKEDNDHDA